MKTVYKIDETGIHGKKVPDNYELQGSELPPQPNTSKEDVEQKTTAALTKQVMNLQLANQQQQATMAALTKQIMSLQLKGATNNV